MRDELENKLTILVMEYLTPEQLSDVRYKISIALSDYEIEKRETEITVWNEDKNTAIINRFLASKLAAGRSKNTCKYYKQSISYFFTKCPKDYDTVTSDDIRIYLAKRVNVDHVTKVTANNERRCISAFFSWLTNEELITKNPMNKIEQMKVTKEKKKAFTEMELEKIRLAAKSKRETAIIEVLNSTWCRVSELVNIQICEINENEVLVHGKGDKDRICYLNAKAELAVRNYLKERKDDNPYLFPKSIMQLADRTSGKAKTADWYKYKNLVDPVEHSDKSTIEGILRKIGKQAGVENVHPHRFRRTGATMALKAGMSLITVSKLLGHANIGITQVYLDISDDELKDAHTKYVR